MLNNLELDHFEHLELDHLALALLLSPQLEVFGSLDRSLVLPLADGALHLEDQLLRGLRLLPQDRLRLTSEPLLLAIIPPPSLGRLRLGGLLVLGHFERLMRLALGVGAVGLSQLRHVHHLECSSGNQKQMTLIKNNLFQKGPRD